ncbi:MAG TPA: hypothetical protein VN181_11225 [Thermoanaerobaculia bacterium]|nr:hypothetical protein [Thermoanaerobaculia bacterium]
MEELVANIEEHIAEVRRGHPLSLIDDEGEIAVIAPSRSKGLKVIRHDPALRLQDFKPTGLGRRLDVDSVDLIREDRDKR